MFGKQTIDRFDRLSVVTVEYVLIRDLHYKCVSYYNNEEKHYKPVYRTTKYCVIKLKYL